MLGVVARRLSSGCRLRHLHTTGVHRAPQNSTGQFDVSALSFLRCPLSRKTLRYDESTNELVNDELGIAYPIVDGIPNMIPQDARMFHKDQAVKDKEQKSE